MATDFLGGLLSDISGEARVLAARQALAMEFSDGRPFSKGFWAWWQGTSAERAKEGTAWKPWVHMMQTDTDKTRLKNGVERARRWGELRALAGVAR